MTSEQKISRMYRYFGESQSGNKCKDCSNLIKVERGNHRVSKCLVYGDTFSEASDWKQSHKAWKTQLNDIASFKQFVNQPREGQKFIAHCYDEVPRTYLFDELRKPAETDDATVLIGPEGDFSIDEVRLAVANGYQSVHLGKSRLRTETAGLSAVMMMQLSKT